jgi:hypothetical protein
MKGVVGFGYCESIVEKPSNVIDSSTITSSIDNFKDGVRHGSCKIVVEQIVVAEFPFLQTIVVNGIRVTCIW